MMVALCLFPWRGIQDCFMALSAEREHYELIGDGEGIHWPELDEDISVEGLLAGRRSAESASSLAKWMETRRKA